MTLPETGQNTPVVAGGRVFFSTMKPVEADAKTGTDIVAWCCDAATGKVLWRRDMPGKHPQRLSGCFGDSTSPPAVCEGGRVVFASASGAIACFDLDGNPLWNRETLTVARTLPFVHEGKYVFTRQVYPPEPTGEFSHAYADAPLEMWTQLQALDLETGEVVWTTGCGVNMGCAILPQRLSDGRAVAVVGRGGGHGPPEKPDGISMVDLSDGHTLWSLPLEGFMATMSFRIWKDEVHLFHEGEHLSVDALTGKILRRVNILENVAVRRWKDGARVTEVETIPPKATRMITQTSNLLVGPWHYFRGYTRPYLGRVQVETGAVEYLELPIQLGRNNDGEDQFLWYIEPRDKASPKLEKQTLVPNSVKNSRGFVVMGDARSTGSGWGHIASPTPMAAGPNLYVPVMNGTVYVIDWNAPTLDESAVVAINDLGPVGEAYTRASLLVEDGRIFGHTIRELICIGKR
ncbi:MAG: PQQ-binding-like beta-propeller repeat protein [Akkermansiaceae bacterium]|nr:PQQ-binding-like beta-propeller repeat protein [Akkermansiaceae bacterium]MCP5551491.1 PQQ-binding-like beta-propeller repeat protein [Akkermansiaceae bacterium]